jgi:2-keto-4-pentenoate hydratase/2-oxohepta-3-ene-1,7-dioic acid hydratase in catechol pathway
MSTPALQGSQLLAELGLRVRSVIGVREQIGPKAPPRHPRLYGMFPTTLADSGSEVVLPEASGAAKVSGQIAVLLLDELRRNCRDPASVGLAVAAGLTFYDSDWYQERHGIAAPSRLMATAGDGWAILGSACNVDTGCDLTLETTIEGRTVSKVSTAAFRTPVPDLLCYLSRYLTLPAGSVLFAGGDERDELGPLSDGDEVRSELGGVSAARAVVRRRAMPVWVPAAHSWAPA